MRAQLGCEEITRRLRLVLDSAGAAAGLERTRVVIVRNGRVAAIERFRNGKHYWVLPGGGVEAGETIPAAALREAREELGVPIQLGPLRAIVYRHLEDGATHRHWCFEASADTDDIAITGGPEIDGPPEQGTYEAVWLDLDAIGSADVWPSALARLVAANRGNWPDTVVEVSEP